GYAGVMVAYTERMLAEWRDGETRDAREEMAKLTLEIVAKTLFDADVRERTREVGGALDAVLDSFERKLATSINIPDWVPTPRNVRFRKGAAVLHDLIERIVVERRKDQDDRGDLLSMLMAARDEETGAGMSEKQLRDEVMTLVLAGHETTANTLLW